MARITSQDILSMGFTAEMLALDSQEAFSGLLVNIIDEQAGLLSARIGPEAYSATTEPGSSYVKRAEKCFVAAEIVRLRIVTAMGNAVPNGDEPNTTPLERSRSSYLKEAEGLIDKIISGQVSDTSGFSSGVLITSSSAKVGDAGSTSRAR